MEHPLPTLSVALAQIEVRAAMPDRNVESMLAMIGEAKKRGAGLVVFPEMSVGGYLIGDDWCNDSACEDLMGYNTVLKDASAGIAVAWGNICFDPPEALAARGIHGYHPNKDGRARRYNAIFVAQNGQWAAKRRESPYLPAGVQAKTLLPNYRIFDDQRYFFSLEDVAKDFGCPLEELMQPFLIRCGEREVPVGFELCEDLWCEDYRRNGVALNPTKMLIANGATRIMNLSASPWNHGKNHARDRRVSFLKKDCGPDFVPFFYVNKVGTQNNGKNFITFDGGTTVYDSNGRPIALSEEPWKPDLLVVENLDLAPRERATRPKIAEKYQALIQGIRHLKDAAGMRDHPDFVIGLSGGIDSAVSLAMLTKAVGPSKILAVNMPTRFNSEKTKDTARALAKNLGVENYRVIPIQSLITANRELLEGLEMNGAKKVIPDLLEENLQAKIRGTSILSNLAQQVGGVFVNNGNKLEVALGYATLYGDWGGAIAILGDLTKAEVYELAHHLNREVFGREVIPQILLPDALFRFGRDQIQPSAELKADQVDPIKIGYHDAILEQLTNFKKASPEDLMAEFIAGTLHRRLSIDLALMERYDVTSGEVFVADLEWFAKTITQQRFKRVQAPPIILTSKSSYGYDIRESITPYRETARARALKQRILTLHRRYLPV